MEQKELVESKILFIDSNKALIKNSNDDIVVSVPTKFMQANEDQKIDVELTEFSCKRNFYAVKDTNNAFDIFYNGTSHIYYLTNGNPTALTLDTELKTDFEAEFSGETFAVSFSNYTGKITITSTFSGAVPSDLSLNFNIENSAYQILGFAKNSQNPFTINSQTISISSTQPINVNGEENIFFRCSLVNENFENEDDKILLTDILAKIPIITSPYSTISFINPSGIFRTTISQKNISEFSIRLTNEDNDLIGLNDNFTATLTFHLHNMKNHNSNKTTEILDEILRLEKLKLINKNLGKT